MQLLTSITLAELLQSENETIRRHAMGILKQLQRQQFEQLLKEK